MQCLYVAVGQARVSNILDSKHLVKPLTPSRRQGRHSRRDNSVWRSQQHWYRDCLQPFTTLNAHMQI
jgi:hypothetical protein